MKFALKNRNLLWAGIWIGLFFMLRLWVSGMFPLVPDETNYWQWSRHPDWGYYDQAPLIAWAIRMCTLALGHTETAVRLPSLLAMALASAYLVRLAHRWAGSAAAWHTALLTQGVLLFNVGSLLATPDALQAAGWAGASYHGARAMETDSRVQWSAAGFWFGFGLLSKYTMIFFPVSVFLFMLLHPPFRKKLAAGGPWLAVAVGMILFFPVIYWNATHAWVSVRHVAHIGGADTPFALHPKFFFEFLGTQAGLLTPLVFLLMFSAWVPAGKETGGRAWIFRYLFFTSVIIVAGFTLLSLHTRVYGNWPGAGYLTGAVLCAVYFGGGTSRFSHLPGMALGRRIWPYAVGSAYLISGLVILQAVHPVLPVPPKWDRIQSEVCGWPRLGAEAHALKARMPHPEQTFLFGLHYQMASELAFYTPGRPKTVSINRWGRPNVYDFWWTDTDLKGKDGIGVTYDPTSHTRQLSAVFERVDPPERLEIPTCGRSLQGIEAPVKVFYLYRCYGFKGGLRWVPPEGSDVRKIADIKIRSLTRRPRKAGLALAVALQ